MTLYKRVFDFNSDELVTRFLNDETFVRVIWNSVCLLMEEKDYYKKSKKSSNETTVDLTRSYQKLINKISVDHRLEVPSFLIKKYLIPAK
jgi:hypothetical protein